MRQWLIVIIATCLLAVTGTTNGQISVPDKIDVHKPIIIGSQGDADVYIWKVDRPAMKIVAEGGKIIYVWAPPGEYEVSLTTITVNVDITPDWDPESGESPTIDKDIVYNEHYALFEVVGSTPTPEPTPNPTPGPTPQPTAFKQKVASGLSKVDQAAMSYKGEVANIYKSVAAEAAALPDSWDAATMVNESKVRVSTSLPVSVLSGWSGFWPELNNAFKELKLSSNDLDGHIKAFNEVAEILEK